MTASEPQHLDVSETIARAQETQRQRLRDQMGNAFQVLLDMSESADEDVRGEARRTLRARLGLPESYGESGF